MLCSRFPSSRWRISSSLVIVFLLFSLTGCGGNATPDVAKILQAVLGAAALASAISKAGSSAKHFLERRIIYLTAKNSSWAGESGYATLTSRLASEMTQVAAFVDERKTTLLGNDPTTPAHRDLQDAARHLTTDGPNDINSRFANYRRDRSDRIAQISWRACAIEADLWGGGDSTLTPALKVDPLKEVLDRRLHAVEFMILHDDIGATGPWTVTSSNSGWEDTQRNTMFEYPWVDLDTDPGKFSDALTAAGLTVADLAPDWNPAGTGRIEYKARARTRPEAAGNWNLVDTPAVFPSTPPVYQMNLVSGTPPADAMENLIPIAPQVDASFEDFWGRNWMYCDFMIAALHVQGVRFGRLRRPPGSDADFNDAASGGIVLLPLVGADFPPSPNLLMPSSGTKWFEGVMITHDELQIGDHLVYWNSPFIRHVLHDAFGLENSFVTGVGSDGHTLKLAGHGMPEKTEAGFAKDMYNDTDGLGAQYNGLRRKINQAYSANHGIARFVVVGFRRRVELVRWDPFGELTGPGDSSQVLQAEGAWWIRIKLVELREGSGPIPTMTQALAMMPSSMRIDPARNSKPTLQAGDFNPDYQEAIYLPLSVPTGISGGWPAYFKNPTPGEALALSDLKADASLIPGFYLHGKGPNSKISVFRPKVQV